MNLTLHDAKATAVLGPAYLWNRVLSPLPPAQHKGIPTTQQAELELHTLTSERDYQMMIWSLISYYHQSGRQDSLVVHDDGSLSDKSCRQIRSYFPDAQIVPRSEADGIVAETFRSCPLMLKVRRRIPHMMKLMDFVAFCRAPRFLIIDSDVLFFENPHDLVDVQGPTHCFSPVLCKIARCACGPC